MPNIVEVQIKKAQDMRETTLDYATILMQKMEDLKDMLAYYIQAGFPADIALTYYNGYYEPDRNEIERLSNDMRTMHVDFLDRVIDQLTQARNQT